MTRIVEATFTCPNCECEFPVEALAGTNVGAVTTEFRRLAIGIQPEPYLVHTCPTCGLSGWDSAFEDTVSTVASQLIAEHLTPLVRDGEVPAWRRYEYAARVAEWRDAPDEDVAHLYLGAAWCYDDENEDSGGELADGYRRQAIAFNQRALESGQLAGNQQAEITYLVGELYRRVGDVEQAGQWLHMVDELVEPDEIGARIATLAKRQRTAPEDML